MAVFRCGYEPGRLAAGNGNTAYDSAGSDHGTLNGDPDWVPGKVGSHALDSIQLKQI